MTLANATAPKPTWSQGQPENGCKDGESDPCLQENAISIYIKN